MTEIKLSPDFSNTPNDSAPIETPEYGMRHLRAPIEIRVEISTRNQSHTTTTQNLAIGGLSFESQENFMLGDKIVIILYTPVNKEIELLKIASEIVWVEKDLGCWMVGAKFTQFAPGDQKRLRNWLLSEVREAKVKEEARAAKKAALQAAEA